MQVPGVEHKPRWWYTWTDHLGRRQLRKTPTHFIWSFCPPARAAPSPRSDWEGSLVRLLSCFRGVRMPPIRPRKGRRGTATTTTTVKSFPCYPPYEPYTSFPFRVDGAVVRAKRRGKEKGENKYKKKTFDFDFWSVVRKIVTLGIVRARLG